MSAALNASRCLVIAARKRSSDASFQHGASYIHNLFGAVTVNNIAYRQILLSSAVVDVDR